MNHELIEKFFDEQQKRQEKQEHLLAQSFERINMLHEKHVEQMLHSANEVKIVVENLYQQQLNLMEKLLTAHMNLLEKCINPPKKDDSLQKDELEGLVKIVTTLFASLNLFPQKPAMEMPPPAPAPSPAPHPYPPNMPPSSYNPAYPPWSQEGASYWPNTPPPAPAPNQTFHMPESSQAPHTMQTPPMQTPPQQEPEDWVIAVERGIINNEDISTFVKELPPDIPRSIRNLEISFNQFFDFILNQTSSAIIHSDAGKLYLHRVLEHIFDSIEKERQAEKEEQKRKDEEYNQRQKERQQKMQEEIDKQQQQQPES